MYTYITFHLKYFIWNLCYFSNEDLFEIDNISLLEVCGHTTDKHTVGEINKQCGFAKQSQAHHQSPFSFTWKLYFNDFQEQKITYTHMQHCLKVSYKSFILPIHTSICQMILLLSSPVQDQLLLALAIEVQPVSMTRI